MRARALTSAAPLRKANDLRLKMESATRKGAVSTEGTSVAGPAIAKTLVTRDTDVVITGWDRQALDAALGDLGTGAREGPS
jgi:hypothetical protein